MRGRAAETEFRPMIQVLICPFREATLMRGWKSQGQPVRACLHARGALCINAKWLPSHERCLLPPYGSASDHLPKPGGTGGGTWTYGTMWEELRRGGRRLSEREEERCQGRDAGRMFKGWEGNERTPLEFPNNLLSYEAVR